MATNTDAVTIAEPATIEDIVFPWIERGLLDLFVAYVVLDMHALVDHRVVFLAQGTEKLAKAYLLAGAFEERGWACLSLHDAIRQSCRYAKNDISHCFMKPLDEAFGGTLQRTFARTEVIAQAEHVKCPAVTGWDVLNLLPRAFLESRYPHPSYLWEDHPATPSGICHDVFGSSSTLDVVRELARIIMERLEADFRLSVPGSKVRNGLNDHDWSRFTATFLPGVP